jgi:hypothetical protein
VHLAGERAVRHGDAHEARAQLGEPDTRSSELVCLMCRWCPIPGGGGPATVAALLPHVGAYHLPVTSYAAEVHRSGSRRRTVSLSGHTYRCTAPKCERFNVLNRSRCAATVSANRLLLGLPSHLPDLPSQYSKICPVSSRVCPTCNDRCLDSQC